MHKSLKQLRRCRPLTVHLSKRPQTTIPLPASTKDINALVNTTLDALHTSHYSDVFRDPLRESMMDDPLRNCALTNRLLPRSLLLRFVLLPTVDGSFRILPNVNIDETQYRGLASFYTSALPNVFTPAFISRIQYDYKVNIVVSEDINSLTRDILRTHCLELFAQLNTAHRNVIAINPSLTELSDPTQGFTSVFTTTDAPELTQRIIAAGGVLPSDAGLDTELCERFSRPFITFPAHSPWAQPQTYTPLPDELYRSMSRTLCVTPAENSATQQVCSRAPVTVPLYLQKEEIMATFPPPREREDADATLWARARMRQLLTKQREPHPRGPAFEREMAALWQEAANMRAGKGPEWEALNAPVGLDECGGVWDNAKSVSLPIRRHAVLVGLPPILQSAELVAASRPWPPKRTTADAPITPAEHLQQAPTLHEGVGVVALRAHPLTRQLSAMLWKLHSVSTVSPGNAFRQYLGQLKTKTRG